MNCNQSSELLPCCVLSVTIAQRESLGSRMNLISDNVLARKDIMQFQMVISSREIRRKIMATSRPSPHISLLWFCRRTIFATFRNEIASCRCQTLIADNKNYMYLITIVIKTLSTSDTLNSKKKNRTMNNINIWNIVNVALHMLRVSSVVTISGNRIRVFTRPSAHFSTCFSRRLASRARSSFAVFDANRLWLHKGARLVILPTRKFKSCISRDGNSPVA